MSGLPASARSTKAKLWISGQLRPGRAGCCFGSGLYWTGNDGATWQDISPPLSGDETPWAISFADADLGRALLGDGSSFTLAITSDGGASWQRQPLDLPGLV